MKVAAKGKSRKGTPFVVRYVETKDARGIMEYINKLSREKTYVTFQGQQVTLKFERDFIISQLKALKEKTGFTLVLIVAGKIVGICNVKLSGRGRKHVGTFGLSLDSSVRGEGLGEKLLRTMLSEAMKNLPGIKIVTLTVMAPNKVATALYRKLGFKKYGNLPKGSNHRGKLVDEVYMYRTVSSRG